jgi:hypothetical protein
MKINIVIDSLILDGFGSSHEPENIIEELKSKLSELVQSNSQFSQSVMKRSEQLAAFDAPIGTHSNVHHNSRIGAEIAQSIYDRLT